MSSQQNGLVAGNKQNEPGGTVPRNRSRFPLSYSFFDTDRFAEYKPFFVMEAVSNDKITLNSAHECRTYSLKAPLMQSVLKKKDYFYVPMQAILPNNWEKFYTNPVIGDDVPEDSGLGVRNFWKKVWDLFSNSLAYIEDICDGTTTLLVSQWLQNVLRFLVFFERFYSNGSLMSSLGIHGANYIHISYGANNSDDNTGAASFDEFFDSVIVAVKACFSSFNVNIGGSSYKVLLDGSEPNSEDPNTSIQISLREALELMRDDPTFTVTNCANTGDYTSAVLDIITVDYAFSIGVFADDDGYYPGLNLGRLWAYQLICHHYYSNDHVDFIYSAELFRQYINQLVSRNSLQSSADLVPRFTVNGLDYLYDALSSHVFNQMITYFDTNGIFSIVGTGNPPDSINDVYAYFRALFGYNRSLRFMDYFTGSRTRPLAIGDSTVDASSGKVDILDMSRSVQMTRFLNAVNRTGRKFGAYMKELFGKVPAPDYHNPFYLAHTSDVVGNSEVENTGAAQQSRANSITSLMRSNASRYAFAFEPDRDCIVMGITYYDIPRVYTRSTEKQNFYMDRFDMFNPFLQFIGDQEISKAELGTVLPDNNAFAYTNRDMEYKQRYNQAAGGFCVGSTQLKNWIFPADELRRNRVIVLDSDFIRSFNAEFDRFYLSLTGYSLGTYFHFIVRNDNRCDASRPMAYSPSIL